jgi:hypothetical protein
MKTLFTFLAVGCFLTSINPLQAERTTTQLTPATINDQPLVFTVKVTDCKNDKKGQCLRVLVTVKAKDAAAPLSPKRVAQLEVFDGAAFVSAGRLEATEQAGELSYAFDIAAKYAEKTSFGFYEDLSQPDGPVAGRYFWFQVKDFAIVPQK